MNNLSELYFNIQSRLFPLVEEEIGELTAKLQEFLRIIELVKPARFITGPLSWCGLGRRLKKRGNLLLAYFLKSVYNLPTTKVLIDNLKGNSTWRQLCGWEFYSQVPSEATFSRAFKEFSKLITSYIESVILCGEAVFLPRVFIVPHKVSKLQGYLYNHKSAR